MQVVEAALKSPAALWDFLTFPDAGYFERLVAASRAGKLFPASWIPKLFAAQNELAKEAALHEFGVQRYPVNEAGPYWQKTPRDRIGTQINSKQDRSFIEQTYKDLSAATACRP